MKITKDSFIGDVILKYPQISEIFLDKGMHCVMCGGAVLETIGDGCIQHGLTKKEVDFLVKKANEMIEKIDSDKEIIKESNIHNNINLKICIPIKENSMKKIVNIFKKYQNKCDMFEVWLDQIDNLNIKEIVKSCPKPLIVVCKGLIEKGNFEWDEKERIEVLIKAAKLGAKYVDVGINTDKKLIEKLIKNKHKSKVIVSYHEFEKTPVFSEILKRIDEMIKLKPDIIKYVSKANNFEDNIQIFRLAKNLKNKKLKFVVMCTGEVGKISRVFCPMLGNEWMYSSYKKGKETAIGQLQINDLKKMWEKLLI